MVTDAMPPPKPRDSKTPLIPARQLFGAHREIAIEYRGTTYRLRITRNDKLILTK